MRIASASPRERPRLSTSVWTRPRVADVDDARELRHPVHRHHEVRDPGADVDESGSIGVLRSTLVDEGDRAGHGAHQGECLKVDPVDGEPGLLGDLDEPRDHVPLGGDDEDSLSTGTVFRRHGREHLEIEDGVVQRYRDGFLRLELDGGAKLLGVDDRELHGAHDDLLVRDSEREALARESALLPEALELGGQGIDVDDFAFEDEALREGAHGHVGQRITPTSALHLGARYRRLLEVDTDAHTDLGHASPFPCLAAL